MVIFYGHLLWIKLSNLTKLFISNNKVHNY